MPLTKTLAQLQTDVQRICQLENSSDIGGTPLRDFVNESRRETYEILVETYGEDYFTISTPLLLLAGTDTYPVPADFYKLRHIDWLRGDRLVRLRKHDLTGKNYFQPQLASPLHGPRYRLQGSNLVFVPTPTTAETLTVYYVPTVPVLVNSGDVATFVIPLEHSLLMQVARRACLERQELDTSGPERTIARLTASLTRAADNRDIAEPFYLDPRGEPDCDDEEWGYR